MFKLAHVSMTYLPAVELCCTWNKVDTINSVSQTISLQGEPPPIQNFIDYPLPLTSYMYLFQLMTCNLPSVGRLNRFFYVLPEVALRQTLINPFTPIAKCLQ